MFNLLERLAEILRVHGYTVTAPVAADPPTPSPAPSPDGGGGKGEE